MRALVQIVEGMAAGAVGALGAGTIRVVDLPWSGAEVVDTEVAADPTAETAATAGA